MMDPRVALFAQLIRERDRLEPDRRPDPVEEALAMVDGIDMLASFEEEQ